MNSYVDSPPFWVALDNFSMQISGLTLKNFVWNCLSIPYQLIIEFLDNIAYEVKENPVNELGNNLSLK